MTRVHVWGASGYAAGEVIRLVHAHASLEVGVLESRSHAAEPVSDHFAVLRATPYRFDPAGSVLDEARRGDVVITAGSDDEARAIVPQLLARGIRVIDLSAGHRFYDKVAYGLSEWYRDAIAQAQLVANPGCYPTAALLALLPLASVSTPRHVIVDAKSGVTGAGRTPRTSTLYAEVSGDIRAYGLIGHRHLPEIKRYLQAGHMATSVTFTPHVVPLARGMLANAYAIFDAPVDPSAVESAYAQAYGVSAFVRVLESGRVPSVAGVVGTNDAELCVDVDGVVVRAICAIDNLGKGAAGQAIQNLNLMLGYPEESGFYARAVVA